MSDIRRKKSVSDVKRGLATEMQRTDQLEAKLGKSSHNVERLSQMVSELTADLPQDAYCDLTNQLDQAYKKGKREFLRREAELAAQLDRERKEINDAITAVRDAGSDAHALRQAARDMSGSPLAEVAGKEAGRLSGFSRDLGKVVSEADLHLKYAAEKKNQQKLREILGIDKYEVQTYKPPHPPFSEKYHEIYKPPHPSIPETYENRHQDEQRDKHKADDYEHMSSKEGWKGAEEDIS